MVPAVQAQIFTTPILCIIWLAGFVLAIIKFRTSPRVAILFIAALIFAIIGQSLEALFLLTVSNMDVTIRLFPGSLRIVRTILNYAPSIFDVLSWALIFAAFFSVLAKKNES